MKIPVREFADVVSALKGPMDNTGASEKRCAARMTVSAKINIHIVDGGKIGRTYSALTRDISMTGMGLLQSVAVQTKQSIIIALPRATMPLFVIGTVMHCRPLADGLMAVGVEFSEMASKETSEMLLKDNSREHARIQEAMLR
jgi:c-di-GMP-binding flagellar brake protein YcgR